MIEPHARPLAAIDADLHASRAVRRGAVRELAEVRRRQEELADLEATLLVTIDTRTRVVDHLLDERLRVVATTGGVPVAAAPHRRLTAQH
jgi:hypothetical protein